MQFEDAVEFGFEIQQYTMAGPGWKPPSSSSAVVWDDRQF